jgi:CRISPR system Cascade subunit CasE
VTAWLTQIVADERLRDVRRDLTDVERLHKKLMMLAPDELGTDARNLAGLLFRLERARGATRLLVQSQLEPNTERLPPGYARAETRKLGPFLNSLTAGVAVHYRIAANPAKRGGRNAGQNEGKIMPLRGAAADAWWATRAPRCGLALRTLTGTPLDDVTGNRGAGGRVRHALTRFDGIAIVTDPDDLRRAVLDGVGRAKSYGAGLLSLAPLPAAP